MKILLALTISLFSTPTFAAEIVDGDTIKIDGTTYRINGIDAPEYGQKCGKWQCGKAAVEKMAQLAEGKAVRCEPISNDGYGRTVATCFVGEVDLGAEMVRSGYAWAFVKYSEAYVQQETEARSAGVGIWQGDFQPPWDYRAARWESAEQKAPEGCPIKGNISRNGMIYHAPWSPWYSRTKINETKGERWFCSEAEAVEAGWRAPHWRCPPHNRKRYRGAGVARVGVRWGCRIGLGVEELKSIQESELAIERVLEIPIQDFALYADESGITQDRHTVIGGTVTRPKNLPWIVSELGAFRAKHNLNAELKWSKISNLKEEAYSDLVELYFRLLNDGILSFHATTFDNSQWDHRQFNQDDPDIGLSKLYYQMILHQYVGTYGDLASLYICLDRRQSSTPLSRLHEILNAGAGKEYGLSFGPVRVLTAKDSKKSELLQLNDVILGAVSAYKNGKHVLPDTRIAKKRIAELVFQKSGLSTYEEDSPVQSKSYTLWNRKPR